MGTWTKRSATRPWTPRTSGGTATRSIAPANLMFSGLFQQGHQGVYKAKELVADNREDLTVGK